MSKMSTSTIATIGIVMAIASIPVGLFLAPGSGFVVAAASLLMGIAGLLRGRKEPPVAAIVWGGLGLSVLAFIVLAVALGGGLFGG